jgi:mannose-6-phosphate isomerase-like protein (cupin superfamily)
MVKTATHIVGTVAVQEDIEPHRHYGGAHVIYIVSGGGTMTHAVKTMTLKPGMIVHVPPGVAHSMRAEDGELTLVDFAQPPFDPTKSDA